MSFRWLLNTVILHSSSLFSQWVSEGNPNKNRWIGVWNCWARNDIGELQDSTQIQSMEVLVFRSLITYIVLYGCISVCYLSLLLKSHHELFNFPGVFFSRSHFLFWPHQLGKGKSRPKTNPNSFGLRRTCCIGQTGLAALLYRSRGGVTGL